MSNFSYRESNTTSVWVLAVPDHDYSFLGNGSVDAQPSWTARSNFNLITKLLALMTNTTLVCLFARYRSVRTPFNVYAVNLCLANLAYLCLLYPTSLYNEWRNTSSPPSKAFCVFHRFTVHGISPVIVHTHLLIALNRLWGLAAPVSYRNYHRTDSLLRPTLICVAVWAYIQLVVLPTTVIDALSLPLASERMHCTAGLRGPAWYANTGLVLVYDAPLVLCLIIYPLIFAIILCTSRVRPSQVSAQHPTPTTNNTGTLTHQADSHNAVNVQAVSNDAVPVVATVKKASCIGRLSHHSDRQFLMLTLLTLNVAISLFPAQLYYTLVTIGVNPSGMFTVVGALYAFGCMFDPILFLVSVKTFKDALRRSVGCSSSK